MKLLYMLGLILSISFPSCAQKEKSNSVDKQQSTANSKTTTYYFIRHAEKDRRDPANSDPNLTQEGKNRAQNWSTVFQDIKFDAIYATKYNRTKQTAQATATRQNLKVMMYDPNTLFSSKFAKATEGKTVLVVGHSNTTPAFVNAIIKKKKYSDIDDNDNSKLFIVSLSKKNLIDQVLTIN
ncbi:SixA phosphatase family protein [Psychroserpens sp.]|uniref:SixA phosphatase family protein n=1 Tax=Psychroserpens sp. TaxID=2020870 RepID=UPI003C7891DB